MMTIRQTKIITLIVVFLSGFFIPVHGDILQNVKIIGNKRISKESVMVLGDIKVGQNFNSQSLNNSLKKLYETNFFSDIKISETNNILTIKLIENPIIEEIEITGIKNKSLIEGIYDAIRLKNRTSYTEVQFKNDIILINNILKTNGYYFSKIKSTKQNNKELNSIKLNISIDLGEKAKIKDIIFIGDKKIKDKKLLQLIASEEHKFWKVISNKVYLNQSLIDLDKRLLENFYKNNGYYNVKILNSFAELNNEGFFKLVFNIDAGKKFFFNDFYLNLPEDYNPKDFKKISKIFNSLKEEKYSISNISLILNEIDNIASSRLYDFIKIEVSEKIVNDNKINFTFHVKDSEKFYVEKINILGNFNTIEEVIRNNLIVDEGDPFNEILFNKSINNIKSLGIFKKVKTEIKDGKSLNTKVVDLTVEEKPTGELSLGAGYGSAGSVIGGGITESNFLGKGIKLKTNIEISNEKIKGSVTYAKPYFNYTDNTLFTTIKSTSEDNLTNSGYKISTLGFSIGTEYEQFENLYFSPTIDLTNEDLTTNSNASTNLKKQEGSYSDFYFNYGLNYDTRDSSFNTTKGAKISFYQELPIITTDSEISNTLIITKYKTLNDSSDFVGKVSLYLQSINSLKNDADVRISKRGKIPYNRLRGFEKGKVGPIDNGDYIGGNYVSTINLSADLPMVFTTVENLDFTYFIDIANVWGVDYDSTIEDSGKIRSATGLAMEFLSPVGPLTFSFAKPITKSSGDKTETFRFNLGTTF